MNDGYFCLPGGPEEQNFQVWSSLHRVSGQFAADALPPLPSEQELPLPSMPSNSDPYVQSNLSHENEGWYSMTFIIE